MSTTIMIWTSQLRISHWVKNILVFVPAVANHSILDLDIITIGFITLALFSLTASSIYVFNDLLDIESDRIHPQKRYRPLASGQINPRDARIVATILLSSVLVFSCTKYFPLFLLLVTYVAMNVAYSTALKKVVILDVIILALMYECRIFAGALMFGIQVSNWLISSSALFFLSLAFSKRYAELSHASKELVQVNLRRGYMHQDLRFLESFGVGCGLSAVTTFALYINDSSTKIMYSRPSILFCLVFVLIYLIGKRWLLVNRGEVSEDPLLSFFSDKSLISLIPIFFLIFYFAI